MGGNNRAKGPSIQRKEEGTKDRALRDPSCEGTRS
uniref:Uncharacterized protein n=1 Tax=Anguilla anguilla TaxID=7936 RepID=A0A0E9QKC1_ANGAN